MDGQRFDRMTRMLGQGKSRRTVLQTVAATVLAGGLGRLGLENAAAACRESGEQCRRNKQCCSKRCKKGKCRCRKLGGTCKTSNQCCSQSCEPIVNCIDCGRCCQTNDGNCEQTSDCCASAICEAGLGGRKRCCVEEGEICGTFPATPLECCNGLVCDANGSGRCIQFGIGG